MHNPAVCGLRPEPVRAIGTVKDHPSALALLALVMFIGACGQKPDRTIHPTPENIPEIEDPRFVLRHEEEDSLWYANPDDYNKITVGIKDGDAWDMIGEIRDMASDGNRTLYVLDKAHSNVRAYEYDGRLIVIFGAAGEGPGEFNNPWNIAVTGEGIQTLWRQSVRRA